MKKKALFVTLLIFTTLFSRAEVKPLGGTFINFFWQDERNNYTNRRNVDQTDPERWACKVTELHEMGVNCLIIVTVANEGLAMYPSDFMPHGYKEGRKSPVEAIMDTADELGMKVFLGCGWAKDQLDDLSDPFVIKTNRAFMDELAALYGNRPSFYGWYIPVEGCFIPYLGDYAVTGVNKIAAHARELTPDAKMLISPYGLFGAEIDNPKFEASIRALDVDIIAYQDEIGCVREQFPMKNMKEHFRQVGEIHRRAGIDFWANIESFTWDRNPNNWYSTLIPASFSRILSQIVGVSEAGAQEIVSFIVCGMFDKPGSDYPVGQMIYANELYSDYMAWLAGDPRWKTLERIYRGDDFGTYKVVKGPQELSDGSFGWENPGDEAWKCFKDGKMECVLDLGTKKNINRVAAHFCNYYPEDYTIPQCMEVEVSKDGKHFTKVKTVAYENWPNKLLDCWTDILFADGLDVQCRYVKVTAYLAKGDILCSEIVVE